VDTTRFTPGRVGEDYVMVSELMPHKRLDVAVEAFSALRLPLLVVGKGPDLRRLKRLAGPTVRFAGHVPDREVERLLSSARAVVVTAREEFGIAAVEAQAAGRPVIALRDGGVVDTVIEGETGVFYDTSTPAALMGAVRGFDALAVDPAACVASSRRFDKSVFMEEFGRVVDEVLADGASSPPMTRRKPKPRLRGLARPAA
jgi:glycosyltransferase involved in cell wall biosynthesis